MNDTLQTPICLRCYANMIFKNGLWYCPNCGAKQDE